MSISPSRIRRSARPSRAAVQALVAALSAALAAGCGEESSGPPAPPAAPAPATPTAGPPPAAPAGSRPGPGPAATPSPNTTADTGAALTFNYTSYDFGVVSEFDQYSTSFPFTNTGTGTLVIKDVKASCGCTVPSLAVREYPPGTSGQIDVRFDPKGKQGVTRKTIRVISNVSTMPVTQLEITSDIHTVLRFDRVQRLGTMKLGQVHRQNVPLYYTDPELKITSVSTNDATIAAELVQSGTVDRTEAGETLYRADVTVTVGADRQWGILQGKRLLVTVHGRWKPDADPVDRTYDMFLLGEVYGDIRAQPAIVSFGVVRPVERFERSFQLVRQSGQPFAVTDVSVADSPVPITAEVKQLGAGAYRVILRGGGGGGFGSFRGRAVITTDVAGEERLEVPFAGTISASQIR